MVSNTLIAVAIALIVTIYCTYHSLYSKRTGSVATQQLHAEKEEVVAVKLPPYHHRYLTESEIHFRNNFLFGLIDNQNNHIFPLQSVDFNGETFESLLINNITLVFKNTFNKEFEDISFLFPIEPNAAIFDLRINIGSSREVISSVEEKEKANKDFKDAKKNGQGAYRGNIDKDQPDVFQIDIGNLPPGETVIIKLRYVCELSLESLSSYRLSIPVGLIQRYSPLPASPSSFTKLTATKDDATDETTREDRILMFPINIDLKLNTHDKIIKITSPTKSPFELSFASKDSGNGFVNSLNRVDVKSDATSAIGDYVLIINFAMPIKSILLLEDDNNNNNYNNNHKSDDGSETIAKTSTGADVSSSSSSPSMHSSSSIATSVAAVSIMPAKWGYDWDSDTNIGLNDQASEIIFVIDQSGSMHGEFIEIASKCLSMCINGLPSSSTFEIIGFGSSYQSYLGLDSGISDFKSTVEFTDASKKQALQVSSDLKADLGGTEILKPLVYISTKYVRSGAPRYVFLLTDGEVSNQNEVEAHVRAENFKYGTKYFTFGIGSGASRGLIENVAKASHGAFEMVDDSDVRSGKLAEKVLRQLSRVIEPSLCNSSIEWKFKEKDSGQGKNISNDNNRDGGIVRLQQSPEFVPPIFKDSRQTVYVEFNKNASWIRDNFEKIVLSGKLPTSTSFSSSSPTSLSGEYKELLDNVFLAPGKALRAIAAKSFLRDLEIKYDLAESQEEKDWIKNRAINISTISRIVCRFTSFIAIERREVVNRDRITSTIVERKLILARDRPLRRPELFFRHTVGSRIPMVGSSSLFDEKMLSSSSSPLPFSGSSGIKKLADLNSENVGLATDMMMMVSETETLGNSVMMKSEKNAIIGEEYSSHDAKNIARNGYEPRYEIHQQEDEEEISKILIDQGKHQDQDQEAILLQLLQAQSADGSWSNVHAFCFDLLLSKNDNKDALAVNEEFVNTSSIANISSSSNSSSDISSSSGSVAIYIATSVNHICIQRKMPAIHWMWTLALRKSARFLALKAGWTVVGHLDISLPSDVAALFKTISNESYYL